MNLRLSDYFLLRNSALDRQCLSLLRLASSYNLVKKRRIAQAAIPDLIAMCCSLLHDEVRRSFDKGDSGAARDLLKLRRDIFNGRSGSSDAFLQMNDSNFIAQRTRHALTELNRQWAAVETADADLKAAWCIDVQRCRFALRDILRKPEVRSAFLTASRSFTRAVDAYRPNEADTHHQAQTEVAAAAYLTRMCTRTIPFGRFSTVGLSRIHNGAQATQIKSARAIVVRPQISLRFLRMIYSSLSATLTPNPERHIYINETHWLFEGRVYYLKTSRKYSTAGYNEEAIGSMKLTSGIKKLLSLLSANENGISHDNLAQELINGAQPIPVTIDQVHDFINKLLEEQLLTDLAGRLSYTFESLQDLEYVARRALDVRQDMDFTAHINLLRGAIDRVAEGEFDERFSAYEELDKQFLHHAAVTTTTASAADRTAVYENSVTSTNHCNLSKEVLDPIMPALGRLVSLRLLSPISLGYKDALNAAFLEAYGSHGVCTNLLELWRRFQIKVAAEGSSGAASSRIGARVSMETIAKLADSYADSALRADEEWDLEEFYPYDELATVGGDLGTEGLSSSVFLELCSYRGKYAIANLVAAGSGKYLSRFMDKSIGACCEEIRGGKPPILDTADTYHCDVLGTFGHNTNVRPRLTERAIRYPFGPVLPIDDSVFSLCEIGARYNDHGKKVEMFCLSDKKRIIPLHLGFLTMRYMPPFHNFLMLFTSEWGGGPFGFQFGRRVERKLRESGKFVQRYPRICIGNVVIRRMLQKIPGLGPPGIARRPSFDTFKAVCDLWEAHGLSETGVLFQADGLSPRVPDDSRAETSSLGDGGATRTFTEVDDGPVWAQGQTGTYVDISNYASHILIIKALHSGRQLWFGEHIQTISISDDDEMAAELVLELDQECEGRKPSYRST